jgi:acyl-CoA thioester hydrolase
MFEIHVKKLSWFKIRRVSAFSFSTEVRVRFAETDAQGVAHNAVYLVWFEVARVAYLDCFAGGYQTLRDRGIEAFVTDASVRYRTPARFDDPLTIYTRCSLGRGARFRFDYLIENDDTTIAEGHTLHACVDASTFRPIRIPPWLVDAVTRAEAA